MFFINENQIAINEVYFGKTPSIQKIENQLDKFRNRYIKRYVFNTHVNSDPDLLTLNRMFEDQFGFGCFSLHIIDKATANAFTMPIDIRYDVLNSNKKLIANKETFKFDKDADYACLINIYSGLIFNPKFTTEEVMACILHEIGHNFYTALKSKHTILANLYSVCHFVINLYKLIEQRKKFTAAKEIISNTNLYKKLSLEIGSYFRENNIILVIIKDYIETFSSAFKSIKYTIEDLVNMFSLGIAGLVDIPKVPLNKIKQNPLSIIVFPGMYNEERTSDNFATMYGYGPALQSWAIKLEDGQISSPSAVKDIFMQIPIISNLYSINIQITGILTSAFDEHPVAISRCYDQLKMLEHELKSNDIDPKMRKVILADCKACRDQIDEMIDARTRITDKNVIRNAFNKALYKNTDCRTLKDILFDDKKKFDIYDKTYKDKFSKED